MISSGFWNTLRMYCVRISLNFLYWCLASLCSDVAHKTTSKYSNSSLKSLIDDLYDVQLKRPPLLTCPWWPPLPVMPPWLRPRLQLLEFDLLVSEARVIVASLMSVKLLCAVGDSASSSGVILFHSVLLFTFWILLNLHSCPCSAWDITPRVCTLLRRQWLPWVL